MRLFGQQQGEAGQFNSLGTTNPLGPVSRSAPIEQLRVSDTLVGVVCFVLFPEHFLEQFADFYL